MGSKSTWTIWGGWGAGKGACKGAGVGCGLEAMSAPTAVAKLPSIIGSSFCTSGRVERMASRARWRPDLGALGSVS